jgi:hypothetical protein
MDVGGGCGVSDFMKFRRGVGEGGCGGAGGEGGAVRGCVVGGCGRRSGWKG